ncbi:MAG: MFS transporter [Firmicutes bacterium]|nr:MFS transporter [Bacillota bacterium]
MPVEASYKRRYVGGRESMAYVLFDSSKSFNIDEYKTRFVTDVLKINLDWNAAISLVNGIWDIVNDGLLGALVDKTKTRWGKFRPYLLLNATLGTVFTSLYWMVPLFFDKNPDNAGKAVAWLALNMTLEAFGTVRGIAETGLVSTMSPNPDDRVRLYTLAEVVSAIWESLPEIVMGALIDLVNHKVVNFSMDSAYIGMGVFTMVTAGALALFFCIFTRERITQASEKHNYREGLAAIFRNKPLLILLLTDFFGGFSAETWEHNYYIDVLGSASLRNVVRIPGAPLSFLSYTYIEKARHRFHIKFLWIFGAHLKDALSALIFVIGSLGGIYDKAVPMVALLMLRNFAYMGTLSIVKIIPREIVLDALEYAEWHSGFRSEGTVLATKGMVGKITRNILNSLTTLIMHATGYSLSAGFGRQSRRAKYALFAMSFGIPALSGLLGMVPKFFYDLTGEKRTRMYEELAVMRKARQAAYDVIELTVDS